MLKEETSCGVSLAQCSTHQTTDKLPSTWKEHQEDSENEQHNADHHSHLKKTSEYSLESPEVN